MTPPSLSIDWTSYSTQVCCLYFLSFVRNRLHGVCARNGHCKGMANHQLTLGICPESSTLLKNKTVTAQIIPSKRPVAVYRVAVYPECCASSKVDDLHSDYHLNTARSASRSTAMSTSISTGMDPQHWSSTQSNRYLTIRKSQNKKQAGRY